MKRIPNKSRIKAWIKALRSGRYKQAQNELKDNEGEYCCLGVACTISKLGRWDEYNVYIVHKGEASYDIAEGHLSNVVAAWYGLTTNPTLPFGDRPRGELAGRAKLTDATTANDDLCWNFKQIADALEERYIKGK